MHPQHHTMINKKWVTQTPATTSPATAHRSPPLPTEQNLIKLAHPGAFVTLVAAGCARGTLRLLFKMCFVTDCFLIRRKEFLPAWYRLLQREF
jgi:hypothetical protein